jgi:hypothetical protein
MSIYIKEEKEKTYPTLASSYDVMLINQKYYIQIDLNHNLKKQLQDIYTNKYFIHSSICITYLFNNTLAIYLANVDLPTFLAPHTNTIGG